MASICGRKTWSSTESFWSRSLGCLLIIVVLEATGGVIDTVIPRFDVFRFIEQPSDTVVERGRPAVLNCSAYHQGSSQTPQIRWFRDDVVMNFDQGSRSRRQKLSNGSLYFTSIEHSRSHQPDEGTYQCVASVPELGSIVSRKAKLQVAYLSRNFAEPPKLLQVHLGDTAMFSCKIEGIPEPSIRWYKDDSLIGPDDSNYYIHVDGVLEISSVQFSDFGRYKCRSESMKRTRVSENVMLTQDSDVSTYEGVPPRLLVRPKDTVALEGDTVVLHCAANGRDRQKQRPKITWLRSGITIDMTNLQSRFSLAGQGSMRIDSVNEEDASTYTCRATNMEDSVDAEVTLTVHVPPTFRKRPHNQYAHTKGDVEFQCNVHGMPEPTVRWIKNGDVLIPSEYFQIVDGHNLRILGLLNTDDGMYQCFAENVVGNTQSSAQLIIMHPDAPPASPSLTTPHTRHTGYATSTSPDPPTPPTRLIAAIVSKRFVTLSWQPPYHTGSSDVVGYSVFWREDGSNRERELNTTTLEANIQHLKPATRYRFKVIAHNAAGPGRRGAQITVETQSEVHVPGPPLNLRVGVMSPTAMKITWDPPAKTTGYITKYKLVYFEEGTEGPGEHDIEINGHSHVLTALKIFRQYSFRVVAYNSNGPGESTEEVTARSYSDVPSKPPQNVSVETDSSNSIIVNWEPPPPEAQNGLITGYKIRYKRKGARKGDTVTTDGNRRSYALTELERNTEYQFRIQALNVNGSSPATQWHYAETFMHDLDETTVPGQPTSLRVRPLTNSIVVSWTPPREQDIMIRGYVLSYGIGSPYVYKQALDAKQRYHTIRNLRPSSEYVISLRTFNSNGEGMPIYETVTTRQESSPEPLTPMIPPVGLQAVVLSSSTILLTWSDTSLGSNQRITDHRYYTVRYNAKSARRFRTINSTDLNAHIDELKPNTEYEFSVKVIKGRRQSTWSLSVFNKTFEDVPTTAPRDLTAVAVEGRPAWISLSWQPPRHANGQITGYLVFYTTDATQLDRDWVVDGIPGDKLSKIIRDLTPETTYYFKLQARNSKGYGPMSPTVIFATPKSDGTGGGKIETPDDYGRPIGRQGKKGSQGHYDYSVIASRNKDRENKKRQSNGIPPLILWVSIGCVLAFILLAILIVTGITCRRRMADSERRKRSSAYMSASKGKMKPVPTNDRKPPPDLWMELKNMDKGGQDGAVTTTGRDSQDMKGGEDGSTGNPPNYDAYDEDRYRRTPVRPKPIMIPVDQPPPPREPIATAVPNGQVAGGEDVLGRPVYPRTQYSTQYASTPRVHAGDNSQPNSEECGRSTWERRKARADKRRHSNSNSHSKLPGPQSPNSPTYQNQPTPIPYDQPPQTGTLPSAAVVSAAPPPGGADGTQSLPRHPQHPLKSFSVPGPPPCQSSTPNTPSPPKHIVKPTPQITAYKKPSPPTGSNSTPCTTPANCRTPVPVVTPMAPDVTMKNNRDDCMHKSYSTEELTAEMANLEGLMKDLTAITQQEFEC